MTRRPRDSFAPKSLTARVIERSPIRTSAKTALPRQFEVSARLDSVHVVIRVMTEVPGFTRVLSLHVEPVSMMSGVTSKALRLEVLLDQLVKLGAAQLAEPVEMIPGERGEKFGAWRTPSDPEGEAWIGSPVRHPRGPKDEAARVRNVADAAAVYNWAARCQNPAPTLAVATKLGLPRSQASRLIRSARDAGLIPPVGEGPPLFGPPPPPKPLPPPIPLSPEELAETRAAGQQLAELGFVMGGQPRDDQGRPLRKFNIETGEWYSVEEQERLDALEEQARQDALDERIRRLGLGPAEQERKAE